jgi:hypothetical protein
VWIEVNSQLLEGEGISVADTPAATRARRAETREVGAAVNRIRTSPAFRLWIEGNPVTPRQAAEVFRIDEYTPDRDRTHKTNRLRELARGDAEIEEFLKEAVPAALALRPPAVGRRITDGSQD